MTIVVGIPKGVIDPEPAPILARAAHARRRVRGERRQPWASAAASPLLGIGAVSVARVAARARPPLHRLGRRRRDGQRHRRRANASRSGRRDAGPVEFVPPDEVRPGQVGTLIDEQANLLDVTATIVDLAVRGYITHHRDRRGRNASPTTSSTRSQGRRRRPACRTSACCCDALFAVGPDREALRSQVRVHRRSCRRCSDALYDDVVTNGWYRSGPTARGCGGACSASASSSSASIAHRRSSPRPPRSGCIPLAVVAHRRSCSSRSAARCRPAPSKGSAMLSRVARLPSPVRRGRRGHSRPVRRASRASSRSTCRTRSCSAAPTSGRRRSKASAPNSSARPAGTTAPRRSPRSRSRRR